MKYLVNKEHSWAQEDRNAFFWLANEMGKML